MQSIAASHEASHVDNGASVPCSVCVVIHDKTSAPSPGTAWVPAEPLVRRRAVAPSPLAREAFTAIHANPRAPPAA